MTDIVERLRIFGGQISIDAAAEILKLRLTLEPFAKAAEAAEPDESDDYTLYGSSARHELTLGHLRAARAVTTGERDV